MTAYLLSESPDGRIELQKGRTVLFYSKEGFTGSTTQFAYKVCDNGTPSLVLDHDDSDHSVPFP